LAFGVSSLPMRPSEIKTLLQSRVEADRMKCIVLLEQFLLQEPSDIQSWYDLACCNDFIGRELEAEPCYKKVHELGSDKLSLRDQKGFYVGYGSTLRNNQKLNDSEKILREGISKFPEYAPLKVFLGLTYYSRGDHKESSRILLDMASTLPSEVMDGYERAARLYFENLD
jgi:tetratricopeptide (TPR) repeat protein